MKLEFSREIFENTKTLDFMNSIQWEPSCSMRTDRQTDRQTERQTDMTKLVVAFHSRANAPDKNDSQAKF